MKKNIIVTGSLGTYTGQVHVTETCIASKRYNPSDHESYPIKILVWKIIGIIEGGTIIAEGEVTEESQVIASAGLIEEKVLQHLKGFAEPKTENRIFTDLRKLGYE